MTHTPIPSPLLAASCALLAFPGGVIANVTFTEHVAPIVFENCSSCHRPGEAAPFALTNFAEVKKRARMIADVVEDSEIKTGRRSEGIFFAANSFAQKAVNGLGVVVAGQILAIIQFPTGAKPGEIAESTVDSLAMYYIPVILVFYVVALSILSLYRINREGHEANLQQLEARSG